MSRWLETLAGDPCLSPALSCLPASPRCSVGRSLADWGLARDVGRRWLEMLAGDPSIPLLAFACVACLHLLLGRSERGWTGLGWSRWLTLAGDVSWRSPACLCLPPLAARSLATRGLAYNIETKLFFSVCRTTCQMYSERLNSNVMQNKDPLSRPQAIEKWLDNRPARNPGNPIASFISNINFLLALYDIEVWESYTQSI